MNTNTPKSCYETQITHSKPGEIIVGGNFTIQGNNAGLAKRADLKINVTGKGICSYCRSDIVSAAKAADVKSVTIYEAKTGLTYYWRPGMKKFEVKK